MLTRDTNRIMAIFSTILTLHAYISSLFRTIMEKPSEDFHALSRLFYAFHIIQLRFFSTVKLTNHKSG